MSSVILLNSLFVLACRRENREWADLLPSGVASPQFDFAHLHAALVQKMATQGVFWSSMGHRERERDEWKVTKFELDS